MTAPREDATEDRPRLDPRAGVHRRPHRFVRRLEAARVLDRHHPDAADATRERDGARPRRDHRSAGDRREVDTTVTWQPVVGGRGESADDPMGRRDRPLPAAAGGASDMGCPHDRQDQGRKQDEQQPSAHVAQRRACVAAGERPRQRLWMPTYTVHSGPRERSDFARHQIAG